jgi:hypothetical protein
MIQETSINFQWAIGRLSVTTALSAQYSKKHIVTTDSLAIFSINPAVGLYSIECDKMIIVDWE